MAEPARSLPPTPPERTSRRPTQTGGIDAILNPDAPAANDNLAIANDNQSISPANDNEEARGGGELSSVVMKLEQQRAEEARMRATQQQFVGTEEEAPPEETTEEPTETGQAEDASARMAQGEMEQRYAEQRGRLLYGRDITEQMKDEAERFKRVTANGSIVRRAKRRKLIALGCVSAILFNPITVSIVLAVLIFGMLYAAASHIPGLPNLFGG